MLRGTGEMEGDTALLDRNDVSYIVVRAKQDFQFSGKKSNAN